MTAPPQSHSGVDPASQERIAAHLITVADVLIELASKIEELGARLCTDPAIITRHIAQLQSIDLIAQKQRWLATMLHADCPMSAVDTIGVEALKERFRTH